MFTEQTGGGRAEGAPGLTAPSAGGRGPLSSRLTGCQGARGEREADGGARSPLPVCQRRSAHPSPPPRGCDRPAPVGGPPPPAWASPPLPASVSPPAGRVFAPPAPALAALAHQGVSRSPRAPPGACEGALDRASGREVGSAGGAHFTGRMRGSAGGHDCVCPGNAIWRCRAHSMQPLGGSLVLQVAAPRPWMWLEPGPTSGAQHGGSVLSHVLVQGRAGSALQRTRLSGPCVVRTESQEEGHAAPWD